MQFINYFFSSVAAFFGLLIGHMLVNIAPEEQKPLEKYFVLMRKALLLLIFAFLAFYYSGSWLYFAAISLLFASLLLIEYKTNDLAKKITLAYAILGVLFYLSSKNTNLFAIESSLILLYGVPTMSLAYSKRKNGHNAIFKNIWFIVISNLLFLFTTFHSLF
ncbi:hypothetical protein HYV80_03050 [Candidatus Woesearchaeota archaeon]|nr:hypothetical protein [Candidatus Woesearchaeota archaeon]